MKLFEALETKRIVYVGTRDNYKINDNNPYILIIDKNYNVDGNGDSILAFNLNYLNNHDIRSLINKVNEYDNKILNISGVKAWLRDFLNRGDYNISKEKKIERYKKLIKKFPELKKAIRRYKHKGILK